ncbi:MAG: heparinase II/III family protein [Lachnospiraceae bacterium]|nr:heparinase II/III family protein [Lachnospiraceae bacterium]
MGKRVKELQKFLLDYRAEVRESAIRLSGEEMPTLSQQAFDLYEQNGNRTIYQALYFPRRMFLAVFGMEAILEIEETGKVDSAVLFKLCDVMEKICREDTWALPAHVNRRRNPDWRETVDLFAAETAQTLSELLDRLNDFLPDKLKDIMEEEINRRVLEPYYLSEVPYAGWEVGANNWAAVCAGSIGSAVIHLHRAGRRLPKPLPECLKRVCAVMPYYFQSFTDDGACMEGLQYYTYGMVYFANFAWELKNLTGEDLFDRPDIAAFPARCFFPDGVSLSFSDSSSRDTFRVGLQALQALEYGNVEFPAMERAAHLHSDSCYRFAELKMDWFATKEYLRQEEERMSKMRASFCADPPLTEGVTAKGDAGKTGTGYRFHILPSAQWCIGYAKNGTGFACKGGHNGESHNHNDVGHLIYEAEGVLFLTDLGAGEYDRDYFSQNRYRAICNHSFGHSVPVLNGWGQREGEVYHCTAFSAAVEENPQRRAAVRTLTAGEEECPEKKRTGQGITAGTGTVSMEIGSAYSLSEDGTPLEGKAVLREVRFDLENGRAEVTDRFDLSFEKLTVPPDIDSAASENSVSVTENLVTQILPVIEENRVYLEQNGAKAVIEIEKLPGAVDPEIRIVEYDHRNHQGEAEKVYGIRWEVPLKDGRGTGRFLVFSEKQ